MDEKIATKLACPVFKACSIKVMPITMDTVALKAVLSKLFQLSGFFNFDKLKPHHNNNTCAAKLAVARTAEADTASMPVLIKGFIMSVATD